MKAVELIGDVDEQHHLAVQVPKDVQLGLKTDSVVRLHKLATLHGSAVRRRLGAINEQQLMQVRTRLVELIGR